MIMADIKIRRWSTNGRQRMIYKKRICNSTHLRKATNCSLRWMNSNSFNKNKMTIKILRINKKVILRINQSKRMKSVRLRIKYYSRIKIYKMMIIQIKIININNKVTNWTRMTSKIIIIINNSITLLKIITITITKEKLTLM